MIIANYIGITLGALFFLNGIYGLLSSRVYGRTWEKYWGGWVYKTQNPGYYWGYVGMSLVVAFVLFSVCTRLV